MLVNRSCVGHTRGHSFQGPRPVHSYTIKNEMGFQVTVWSYGSSLVEVMVPDRCGMLNNWVLRYPNLDGYEKPQQKMYLGATTGRYSRCVENSRFCLDGNWYELNANDGPHHMHGGPCGFDAFVWDSGYEEHNGSSIVKFRLVRPDGDQGYPGGIQVETTYCLRRDNTLEIRNRAKVDAPTICDITNHALWNLSIDDLNIDRHELSVAANAVLAIDDNLIPAGVFQTLDGHPLDFREKRELAGVSLDNCFLLDAAHARACLSYSDLGHRLTIRTTEPGIQIYTGDAYRPSRSGICLQPGSLPNSPVREDFPTPRLAPGELYENLISLTFDSPFFI